jgi:hypothetical protein
MGKSNPRAELIYLTLMDLIQGLEHVDVPLPELMNPFRDQVRAVGVPDHRVKTTLVKSSQV